MVARLVRVGEVRSWLCGHQDSKIGWSEGRGQAYVKKEEGMGKKKVMKHMAELWLRQEVKELEKEAGKEGGVVVVDGQALSTNLQMVKRTLGLKYPRLRERKDWDRFQLLECLQYFMNRGGVTLLTGDPDLLTGGEDGVGWLPDLVVENVEGFVPRFLGLEEKGGKERRGRGRPVEKRVGKLL